MLGASLLRTGGDWVRDEDDCEVVFRFSSVKSFFETDVLNLNRLEPNNLDKKFPSWSFCLCFECVGS